MQTGDIVKMDLRDYWIYGTITSVEPDNKLYIQWRHPAFRQPELISVVNVVMHWSKKDQDIYYMKERIKLSKMLLDVLK